MTSPHDSVGAGSGDSPPLENVRQYLSLNIGRSSSSSYIPAHRSFQWFYDFWDRICQCRMSPDQRRDSTVDPQRLFDEGVGEDYVEIRDVGDEQVPYFQYGRDYESVFTNHQYTEKERQILASYETLDYLPPDCEVYRDWIRKQPPRLDWDRWIMMGLIGFVVGIVGFLLHQLIDLIADYKWIKASEYVYKHDITGAWLFVLGYSLLFLVMSALLVVYVRPSAASSGMPELIGFLNGTLIRHIFNIKTLAVKFASCAFAVGSGMPVGPEGPMIHIGSLIGAGISQFQSRTLGFSLPFFDRFRNSADRRNFISAGAAAGIASAFCAPVGGLLFAMEEVSSYWNMKLSWQTFFCCMVSAFTTDLLSSAFDHFQYDGQFGLFKTDRYILFQIESMIDLNIIAILPCFLFGFLGGGLGSLFTFLNLKIMRLRRSVYNQIKNEHVVNIVKFLEPVIIIILTCTLTVLVPLGFPCSPYKCVQNDLKTGTTLCENFTANGNIQSTYETNVEFFTCNHTTYHNETSHQTFTDGSFNQAATLFFTTGEQAIHHLFSRSTHIQFDYPALLTFLVCYYLLACWAAGTYISSGLVVPMLLIGGLYGRIVGRILVDLFGIADPEGSEYMSWIDPGAMALLGAVSFFGGVTRLTMSLTVIMVEMTNDIRFLLLIMITVMITKWVGDFFTHPFYHAHLELKCIPFLDDWPMVVGQDGKYLNLELYHAEHVMVKPVKTFTTICSVSKVAKLLLKTTHGGFPIVESEEDQVFKGTVNRSTLVILLTSFADEHDYKNSPSGITFSPRVEFTDLSSRLDHKLPNPEEVRVKLENLSAHEYPVHEIDLSRYVNTSAITVPTTFALQRTYIIFRSLGLRHLVVVGSKNRVAGIITRKDLMGFSLEERLGGRTTNGLTAVRSEQNLQSFARE